MEPTEEQATILKAVAETDANLMVNALAGTGKTTTLDMIQKASKVKPILCLMFNKRAAEDAEKKFGGGTTTIRTFNSLGHRVWQGAVGRLNVSAKKMADLFKQHADTLTKPDRNEMYALYWDILNGCSLAKALGYVPEGKYTHARRLITQEALALRFETRPDTLTLELIDTLLLLSIQTAYKGWVDYNDQIYMPALFGGTFPRFPNVLVDEWQDLNPTNTTMLEKLVKGRLCGVGDPWQSIYAFRGAITGGMAQAKQRFSCEEYDLSVSFRCPQAVVEHAHWRVPHFKAHKPGGTVRVLNELHPSQIPEGAAIICRNNAPLFRTALGLLMAQRSVSVSGSELGPKLVRLLQKICSDGDSQDTMLGKIEGWREEKLATSQAEGSINDQADCMIIFASFGKTLTQAVAYVEHIFKQQGAIKLLTGHKAKGGEWDVVNHLDPFLCREEEQDLNLRYVITTRSAEKLYEIDGARIKWFKQ